jgi:phosphotransferase system IIB component
MTGAPPDDEANVSVAGRVLAQFVEAVGEQENLADVAARLRPLLKDGTSITETALRQALFGDADA